MRIMEVGSTGTGLVRFDGDGDGDGVGGWIPGKGRKRDGRLGCGLLRGDRARRICILTGNSWL